MIPGVLSAATKESTFVHILSDSGCPPAVGTSPVCGGPIACDPGDTVVAIPTGTGASVWLASVGMDCAPIGDDFLPAGPTYRPGQVGERGLRTEARFTAACPAGTLMVGVDLRTTYAFITVRARCLEPADILLATEISANVQLSTIAGFDSAEDVWQRADCPAGSVVTGFALAGTTLQGTNQYVAVDGLSLQCRDLGTH